MLKAATAAGWRAGRRRDCALVLCTSSTQEERHTQRLREARRQRRRAAPYKSHHVAGGCVAAVELAASLRVRADGQVTAAPSAAATRWRTARTQGWAAGCEAPGNAPGGRRGRREAGLAAVSFDRNYRGRLRCASLQLRLTVALLFRAGSWSNGQWKTMRLPLCWRRHGKIRRGSSKR